MQPVVQGHVHPDFEPVREAFEASFARGAELGASFCAFYQGERVVDLWGGLADRDTKRPWEPDTLALVFSSTKGLAATCMLILQDRGLLDVDAPVAEYWPGFARNGKEAITVAQLLEHRSGLCAIDVPLKVEDFAAHPDRILEALESQEPLFPPGSEQAYCGVSYGPYVAELFRRVAGRSIGSFLAKEVAEPLGADVHLGLPEVHRDRVATLYPAGRRDLVLRILPRFVWGRTVEGRLFRSFVDKDSPTRRAFQNPAELGARGMRRFNDPEVQGLELAWASGMVSARGIARVYAALAHGGAVDGVRLVREETVRRLYERRSWTGYDRVLHKPMGFSLGFMKEERRLFSPNDRSFGHPGVGGSLGWCDPDRHLAWGYVPNRLGIHLRSPRAIALSHALYACL